MCRIEDRRKQYSGSCHAVSLVSLFAQLATGGEMKTVSSTYTSQLYPDSVVIGQAALQVRRQLAGVYKFAEALQAGQVGLK